MTRERRLPRSPTSSLSGIELFVNAVWHRSKAKLTGVLTHKHSGTPTNRPQTCRFPPEIVEIFIAHLKYDTPTLKACAATCFCWYNIAILHLHRTLVLQGRISNKLRNRHSNPLPSLFKLGLLPLAQQLQFRGTFAVGPWVVPAIFNSRNMRYFRAMVDLQELKIGELDFSKFPEGFGEYLGHFAPTLRSVSLSWPEGTRRQLFDFFRLFPKLDDIEISCYNPGRGSYEALDNQLIPINGGLRGKLTLNLFGEVGLLEDMIVAFGGMRFTSMDLRKSRGIRLLLDACAGTLETLRIYPEDIVLEFPGFDAVHSSVQVFDLSSCTALRFIEVPISLLIYVSKALSTITSPVFSELTIIFSENEADFSSEILARATRELYGIKELNVAFCLESLEKSKADIQRKLAEETERAVAAGLYDFLPRPPLVVSRTVAKYIRRYTS